jgi:hypothetical protein
LGTTAFIKYPVSRHREMCIVKYAAIFFLLNPRFLLLMMMFKDKAKLRTIFFHPSSSTHHKRKNSTTHFFPGMSGWSGVRAFVFFFFAKFRHLATPKKKVGRGCES